MSSTKQKQKIYNLNTENNKKCLMSDKSAYFIDTETCSKLQFQMYCFYCIKQM